MKTLVRVAAIAVAVIGSAVLALPAAAQDADSIKPLRDKSMLRIQYEEPTDARLRPIYLRLKQFQVLERLQAFLAPLRLPRELTVKTQDCGGRVELPYRADAPIVICYEYVALIEQVAPPANDPIDSIGSGGLVTRDIALVGPFVQLALHNTARSILEMLDIPVWGNIEDAADALAAFVMIEMSPAVAEKTIFGTAYFFAHTAQKIDMGALASTRPLVQQRYYNLLCIAVGSDLVRYSMLIPLNRTEVAGDLPRSRLGSCLAIGAPQLSEYSKVSYAFRELILKKYVDPQLFAQVRSIEWLKND